MSSGAPEGQQVPAPLVTPIMLLLLQTWYPSSRSYLLFLGVTLPNKNLIKSFLLKEEISDVVWIRTIYNIGLNNENIYILINIWLFILSVILT